MADVDLFVIGGGSGGVACARRAASYGARVALAESSRVGGTCVIRGCVPKKLMHYGAHFAAAFKAARGYGWQPGDPRLDFRALLKARNDEIARLNGIYLGMLERSGVRLIAGRATIAGRGDWGFLVEVGGERVAAKHVLIATGARPNLPPLPGIEHAITSDHALEDLYEQPRRLAVVGAGYIGVELASIFNGLGTETTLVLRGDKPLRGFDEDLRSELTEQLTVHGLRIRPGVAVDRLERTAEGVRIVGSDGPVDADMVLYATGREPLPNTRGLGLAELGVELGPTGAIAVDATYESSVPGLLAVGDCSNHGGAGLRPARFDLTPVAIAEGRNVAERLFNDRRTRIAYDTMPTAVFGVPQAGAIGLTEAEARAGGHDVLVFRSRFRPMLHTLTGLPDRTMMKLVVDKATDRVLGLHMVGEDAAEIVQGFAVAMTVGATKADFDATVALHPSAAEEFVTMHLPVAS
ncbi:MAG: glutathione-disulfide reductase [Geminicoccaceae bacterium]